MNLAAFTRNALWLSALALGGCGNSAASHDTNGFGFVNEAGPDATQFGGDDGAGGGNASSGGYMSSGGGGNQSGGSTPSSSGSGGGGCMATCKTDSDCQTSCPAPTNGGMNCCDTGSGTCFSMPMTTCPSQPVGAAE